MANEFKLPELGENVQSGDVVGVLVSVGDIIKIDDPILELETDKATVEVPATVAGTVTSIYVKEGDTVEVGQVVLTVDDDNGQVAPPPVKEVDLAPAEEPAPSPSAPETITPPVEQPVTMSSPAAAPEKIEVTLPDLGENVEAGTVVGILVAVGDTITQDQPVLELETDKATVEMPAPVSGVILAIHVQDGAEIKVGQPVLTVETGGDSASVSEQQSQEAVVPDEPRAVPVAATAPEPAITTQPEPGLAEAASPEVAMPAVSGILLDPSDQISPETVGKEGLPVRLNRTEIPAAPNVRRIAREIGVNITAVKGSGPNGRVSMDDVKRHASRTVLTGVPVSQPGRSAVRPTLPDFSRWGSVEHQPMSNIRRATARQMEVAWSNIPHVTQFHKADITNLEQLRKQFGKKAEAVGGKLTVTAILLKVLVSALKEFPQFNASIDMDKEEVIYKNYYHIGVAVDTDRGLLVPVIRMLTRKT
jgi:pyruvate dehydrogenase E2 component (dihydrolipoamide acetyltransferase)